MSYHEGSLSPSSLHSRSMRIHRVEGREGLLICSALEVEHCWKLWSAVLSEWTMPYPYYPARIIVGSHEPRPAQHRSSRQFPPSSGSQDRTDHPPAGGRTKHGTNAESPPLSPGSTATERIKHIISAKHVTLLARNEAEKAMGLYAVSSHACRYNSMMGVKPRKSDRGVPDDSENGNGHDSEHVRGNVRGISYKPNRSLIRLSCTQESTVLGVTTFGRPMPCEMQQRRDGVLPSFCESKLAVLQ
ncbi:uncharacterized protein RAG0_14370 [Rhynchosporium agropyri]|uniref:Uncharacterized protein n=1 Tax=Rhynchosporium agropyri TaxID=914238 RepID=A0A1E1LGT2_9HELO|nr:uncharacterized protein RAG0_14370 [Rhynchosporium agropyri]